MDYQKIYLNLIKRAQHRNQEDLGYTENHHIIPRCQGGSDDPSNLVVLTGREHFFVHRLLVSIYPNSTELLTAFILMSGVSGNRSSRKYSKQKKEFAKRLSEKYKGVKFSPEKAKKMADARRGIPLSEDRKKKISKALTGRKMPEAQRLKCIASHLGQKAWNKGLKGAQVAWNKGIIPAEIQCPECLKIGKGPVMYRHHFKNCKRSEKKT